MILNNNNNNNNNYHFVFQVSETGFVFNPQKTCFSVGSFVPETGVLYEEQPGMSWCLSCSTGQKISLLSHKLLKLRAFSHLGLSEYVKERLGGDDAKSRAWNTTQTSGLLFSLFRCFLPTLSGPFSF